MTFTDLVIDNVLSYEHLEFDLNQGGTVLIVGPNGSGKSSVWDALSWALFGVTLKGLKGDEVVSLFAGKNACVSITIEDDDSVFTISRYRKHSEHKNDLFLYQNGEDISGWSIEATQDKIYQLLGMDVKLFTNSVMFAQGHSQFFAALGDKDQKEMIENFIDTTVWDTCLTYTKEQIAELSTLVAGFEKQSNRNEDRLEFLGDALEDLREKQANSEKDRENDIKEMSDKVKLSIKSIKSATAKLEQTKKDASTLSELVETLEGLKEKAKTCPKCNQPLPFAKESELRQARKSFEAIDRELYNLKIQLRTLEGSKTNALEALSDLQETENAYSETIDDYEQQEADIHKDQEKIQKDLDKHQQELALYQFWLEGFSNKGIKSFLFEGIIPEFNSTVARYTEIMTEGEIQVQLSSTSTLKSGESREKFALNIFNSEGSNTHKGSSGGERRSIDLSIMWTLQDLARNRLKSSISFEVTDEALDTLDDAHIDSVLQVLAQHARKRTVFVVSHNDTLKSSFDTVYYASKAKRKSSLIRV